VFLSFCLVLGRLEGRALILVLKNQMATGVDVVGDGWKQSVGCKHSRLGGGSLVALWVIGECGLFLLLNNFLFVCLFFFFFLGGGGVVGVWK
jgi:hypothetical protein